MNDFQIVRNKRNRRKKIVITSNFQHEVNEDFDVDRCREQINICKSELSGSKFWTNFYGMLCHAVVCELQDCKCSNFELKDVIPFDEVIVYGIGSIANSVIARYQFGLLLLLQQQMKVTCKIYDPVLSSTEVDLMKQFGIELIGHNEECKRKTQSSSLFFMLHCGKMMYNNLLWANWNIESLKNICIVGNAFSSYEERIPSRVLLTSAKYIKQILPYTVEHVIENNFHHEDIFNDTSIHTFPDQMLVTISPQIWEDNSQPCQDIDDTEIIISK